MVIPLYHNIYNIAKWDAYLPSLNNEIIKIITEYIFRLD